ncbi:MAG: Smr/MutS family protein, partial [Bacilli bacterium]|nr:Smr/MutS family protein [Bacilli bacterium]
PLIDSRKVVANSYHVDENKRLVVISGPNAGGKTVSLKTIGLIVLMNQCGLAVPANKAELGYFKNIYIDIGDNQSLSDNLSTFSAHMTQIGEITRLVRGKDLVLIDELGTGTDPREGEALAISVSKHLIASHALCFISSHFSGLKEFALTNTVIENSSMLFDEENLSPTYHFKLGAPGKSYGMEVAERYGVSSKIIEEAKIYLSKNSRSETEELISSLQKKVENASKIEEQLKKEKEEFDKQYKQLQNDQKILKERREKLLESVKEEKQEMLDSTREELSNIIKIMSKGNLSLNEVISLRKRVEELEDKEETEVFDEKIEVGDVVSIPSLELYGKVDRINGSKAHFVSETGISLEVELNRLHKVEKSEKRAVHKVSKPVELDVKSVPLELNIIGMHTDEGKEALMMYLDNCRYKHMSKVRIIHGFGSGALRKMVHNYLATQKDLTFKLADGYEGGGGATVVTFNERKGKN